MANERRHRRRAAMYVLLVTGNATAAGIPPGALPGSARAAAALERCATADHAHGAARADLLQEALALAEEAVDADDADARAHFATFCALGKQMRDAGLSVFNLGKLRRVRREIDRTLELARVLAANGAVDDARREARRARETARVRPGGTAAEEADALLAEIGR